MGVDQIFTKALENHKSRKYSEAIRLYKAVLMKNPKHLDANYLLGTAYAETGNLEEAMKFLLKAEKMVPGSPFIQVNLGNVYKQQGQYETALMHFKGALEIKHDIPEAHYNLGSIYREHGLTKEAEACFKNALDLVPGNIQYAIYLHLSMPIIAESSEASKACLERYKKGISSLKSMPGYLNDPTNRCNSPSFYLAYHNHNNKSIMTELGQFFREKSPELNVTSPHVKTWSPPVASGRRIRVGIVSQFLVEHTIGKLYQGFIRHLDRSRFEVIVVHTCKSKLDGFSQEIDGLAERSIVLPVALKDQQEVIASEEIDVLFFPDIGMEVSTYFLAFARLAPVQVVSWGHPDTTGLDTMDYFLSAESIEPDTAEDHYSERLIRFNRLPCHYQPLIIPEHVAGRSELGLPETGTIYACPQALFKFHPEFDPILAEILKGDESGHIVILDGKYDTWTTLLRERWEKTFPELSEKVIVLPRMPLGRFMELMAHVDVLLDPIHFGSGNTLYEGMVHGTPIVTWPGHFMRGRIVAGAYRQMDVKDAPVAATPAEYAPLAISLGKNPERRQLLREELLNKAALNLFADMTAIREFEEFLEASVEAAGRGEKLPVGWRPSVAK